MLQLGEPLGWGDEYRGNITLQDDYLAELNITTYNQFKEYLFWDVIEALAKVYLVNTDMKSDYTKAVTDQEYTFNSQGSYDEKSMSIIQEYGGPDALGGKIGTKQGQGKSSKGSQYYKKKASINFEQRMQLRLELEFENIDNQMMDVLDVEEIKRKESRIKKAFW